MKYRILGPFEILREGDEWQSSLWPTWRKTSCAGERAFLHNTYRRPIKEKKKKAKKKLYSRKTRAHKKGTNK